MSLETANYIHQLNVLNPVGTTDFLAQGDNHIRLVKTATQQTFPNVSSALSATATEWNLLHTTIDYDDSLNQFDLHGNIFSNVASADNDTAAQPISYNDGRYVRLNEEIDGSLTLRNDKSFFAKKISGTAVNAIKMDTTSSVVVGDVNTEMVVSGSTITLDGAVTMGGVSLLSKVYPIGSVYQNATDSRNPATILGFGTWYVYAEGRVIVCKSADTEFSTIGKMGGSKSHRLSIGEMPPHSHDSLDVETVTENTSTPTLYAAFSGLPAAGAINVTTSSAGGNEKHTNTQPYRVVKRWRRAG